MTKRSQFVNNIPLTIGRVHVTSNTRNGRTRYTFHFPYGVVFHSSKSSYTRKELLQIYNNERPLDASLKEAYSSRRPKEVCREDRIWADHQWALSQTTVGEEQDYGA